MTYISLKTAEQLKAWGCEVQSECYYIEDDDFICVVREGECLISCNEFYPFYPEAQEFKIIKKTYDLHEIICDGEMAKAFFMPYNTEGQMKTVTRVILLYLQRNEQETAEQYLLDNCIFNPENK